MQVLGGQVFDGPEVRRRTIVGPLSAARTHAASGRPDRLRLEHLAAQRRTPDRKIHHPAIQVTITRSYAPAEHDLWGQGVLDRATGRWIFSLELT